MGNPNDLVQGTWTVLLSPLPFKDPSELMRVYEQSADGNFPYNTVAGGVFIEWEKQNHSFADLALLLPWPEIQFVRLGARLADPMAALRTE